MRLHEERIAERVTRGGVIVAMFSGGPGCKVNARLYAHEESRGYKTGYMPKRFFYLVGYAGMAVAWIHGVTNDARRHTVEMHWDAQGITAKVLCPDLYAEWRA